MDLLVNEFINFKGEHVLLSRFHRYWVSSRSRHTDDAICQWLSRSPDVHGESKELGNSIAKWITNFLHDVDTGRDYIYARYFCSPTLY